MGFVQRLTRTARIRPAHYHASSREITRENSSQIAERRCGHSTRIAVAEKPLPIPLHPNHIVRRMLEQPIRLARRAYDIPHCACLLGATRPDLQQLNVLDVER